MIRGDNGHWYDTAVFREEALKYRANGYYCDHPKGTLEYNNYWDEQLRRCKEGYMYDGQKITGHHYFYLNFCNINMIDVLENNDGAGTIKESNFPDFWDWDYEYFWWLDIARFGVIGKYAQARELLTEEEISLMENREYTEEELLSLKKDVVYNRLKLRLRTHDEWLDGGHHMIIAKSRRKGFSYKNTALCVNTYNTVRNSQCLIGVIDKKYSDEDMRMIGTYLDVINDNTAWGKRREVKDRYDWKRASYIEMNTEGKTVEKGYKSEIRTVSYQDNPEAANSKSPYYMLFEEAGIFNNLKKSWDATVPTLKAGKYVVGQAIIFGCVCAGTKVWTSEGRLVNIEDLKQSDGILGYLGDSVSKEPISYMQEKKEKPCYRITTSNGTVLECSEDHPILIHRKDEIYSKRKYIDGKRKTEWIRNRAHWSRTDNLKVGDNILTPREVPVFGNVHNEHARLIGLLIGDGSYGFDKTPVLSNCDKDINDYVYGRYDCRLEKSYMTSTNEEYRETRIRSICGILRDAGIYGQTRSRKRLPVDFDKYDKESFCELIGGLFDTDGYVYVNNGSVKINIAQSNYEIISQIKTFLIKIGVHCSISVIKGNRLDRKISDKNEYYRLSISDNTSVLNFYKNVKLLSSRKQSVLNQCVSLNGGSRNDSSFVVVNFNKKNKKTELTEYNNVTLEKIRKIEYIGEKEIYNLTADLSHTYIANNLITHNTGGVISDNNGEFSDMFYDPMTYNMMPFQNVWDEGCSGDWCGFFFSATYNLEGFYDKQGNSDMDASMDWLNKERKRLLENARTIEAYNGFVIQFPICPKESFKTSGRNIFNIPSLETQLSKVRAEKLMLKKGTCVKLEYTEDGKKVKAKPILSGNANPILEYRPKNSSLVGCPIIYEYPVNDPPFGLYKIGYDPYAQEHSTTDSLSAIFVYKGILRGNSTKNIIVAEYVGRPETADQSDEIALKFAILYNTAVMFENNVNHTHAYFSRKHQLNRLCLQPDRVISKNIKGSKVARKFGCHLDGKMKTAGEEYLKEYLMSVIDYDENGDEVTAVDYIYSIGLLEELIKYYRDGNFDRVCALFQIMFQLQDEELEHEFTTNRTNNRIEELRKLELFKRA